VDGGKNMVSFRANRIEYIAKLINAKNYLEIGVNRGDTFFNVNLQNKIGVDPAFKFIPENRLHDGVAFFQMPSDIFFEHWKAGNKNYDIIAMPDYVIPDTFDIIFIDGLHTFEQSLRDFENSLQFSHDTTVWVLDDTIPSDPYSAEPDCALSQSARKAAGIADGTWQGDVYKTVLAIHDQYTNFSYLTLISGGPQTIIWKSSEMPREPFFTSLHQITMFTYFDMLRHAWLYNPITSTQFIEIFMNKPYKRPDKHEAMKLLQYFKIKTLNEITLRNKLRLDKFIAKQGAADCH
jgi:hypothetical protein